jgi:hypothetical protein
MILWFHGSQGCCNHGLELANAFSVICSATSRWRFTPVRDSAINTGMSTQELIIKEVEKLPESLQQEVYNFARSLRERSTDESFNGLLLSDSALRKDWDTPEEDDAWANL